MSWFHLIDSQQSVRSKYFPALVWYPLCVIPLSVHVNFHIRMDLAFQNTAVFYCMNHLLWEQLVAGWLWPQSSEHMAITTEERRKWSCFKTLWMTVLLLAAAPIGALLLLFIKMSDTSWSRNLTRNGGDQHYRCCYCLKDKSFVLQL